MPFVVDDLILLGLAAAPIAGLLGLNKTSKSLDEGGSARQSYTPPQHFAPPQPVYSPQPPIHGHGAPAGFYDTEPPYAFPDDGYGYGGYQPENQVILEKTGAHFYAKLSYGRCEMTLLVDTGATYVSVGDSIWRALKAEGIRSTGRGKATTAGGRVVSTELFTFPYLTLTDGQGFITLTDVKAQYLPGESGLLGMSFLDGTDYRASGNQMIIRG